MKQYVGKRVIVTTQNTRYEFDVFAEDDVHGEAFALNGGVPRYLNGRHSDVEIKGTKLVRLPWEYAEKRVGEIVEGGYLYFRYFSHFDYITTTRIEKVEVVDLPNH